jgi:hypothetical protein
MSLSKTLWIKEQEELGADRQVLEFIANVRFHGAMHVDLKDSEETIRCLYEAGYCYYFARMLEEVFSGGVICVLYPFGHICYVYDGVAYDINGILNSEFEYLLPLDIFDANDFKQIPDYISPLERADIDYIAETYLMDNEPIIALVRCPLNIEERTKKLASSNCKDDAELLKIKVDLKSLVTRLDNELCMNLITKKEYNEEIFNFCKNNRIYYNLYIRLKDKMSSF